MKQTMSVLLCLLLTVSLMAGCGSKEKIATEPASQSEAASAAEEKPMELAAPINGKEKYDIDATCYQEVFTGSGRICRKGSIWSWPWEWWAPCDWPPMRKWRMTAFS